MQNFLFFLIKKVLKTLLLKEKLMIFLNYIIAISRCLKLSLDMYIHTYVCKHVCMHLCMLKFEFVYFYSQGYSEITSL